MSKNEDLPQKTILRCSSVSVDLEGNIIGGKEMATYNDILNVGEKLKKCSNEFVTYEQLKRLLMRETNVHTSATLKHYMQILQSVKIITPVSHNECLMFKILR
jgi:hypothetical protein